MRYEIVTATTTTGLSQQVQRFVRDGWIPAGGVGCNPQSQWSTYFQALTLSDDDRRLE